jgi:hypothetical protein
VAWEIIGEDYMVIGVPGGGEPAIWDEDSQAQARTGTETQELDAFLERGRSESP